MKFTKTLPTTGNFVAVWQQDSRIDSESYYYKKGVLYAWDDEYYCWYPAIVKPWISYDCTFVVRKEKK